MRFWNPIRESTFIRNSIFTTTDTKTGRRVVGIEIPANQIRQLLTRIEGGASTVNADQLHDDVLKNALTYELESGIQVRQGRIGRDKVIQMIPPNAHTGEQLKALGLKYERGVTPVYYVPNTRIEGNTTHDILRRVLEEYPVKAEQQPEAERNPSFRPTFEPLQPSTTPEGFVRQAQAEIDQDGHGEQHLYVNTPAIQILRDVIEELFPGSTPEHIDGATLSICRTESVIRTLLNSTRQGNSALWPAYRLLVKRLRKAQEAQTHAVTVVHAGPGVSEERTRNAETEEALHRALARASNNKALPEDVAAHYLEATPSLVRAAERTRKLRPYLTAKDEVVHELAAYLISGEWDKIHLSAAEATEAWHRLVDLFAKEYGEHARDVLHGFAQKRSTPHYAGSAGLSAAVRTSGIGPADDTRVSGPSQGGDEGTEEGPEGPVRYRPADEERPDSTRTGRGGPSLRHFLEDETGTFDATALAQGVRDVTSKHVLPHLKSVSRWFSQVADDTKRVFAPQTRGKEAKIAAGSFREMMGTLAQKEAQVTLHSKRTATSSTHYPKSMASTAFSSSMASKRVLKPSPNSLRAPAVCDRRARIL